MTCFPLRGEVDRMAEHEVIKEQLHTECISDCDTVCSFLKLTDEMVLSVNDSRKMAVENLLLMR